MDSTLTTRFRQAIFAAAALLLSGVPFAQAQSAYPNAASSHAQSAAPPQQDTPTPVPWGLPTNAVPVASGGSYDLLTRMREENVLLNEQLKIAQKRKALEQLEGSNDSADGSASGSSTGSSLADIAALGGETRVLLVEGRPGNVRAMVSLPSGGTIMVQKGDLIPHVGTVVSISVDSVKVRDRAHRVTVVPFWNKSDSGSTGSSALAEPAPPPIPATNARNEMPASRRQQMFSMPPNAQGSQGGLQ